MTKDKLPKSLQMYWDHQFSSGPTTGGDYKTFERRFRAWMRKELEGYTVKMYPNHYEFSAVITRRHSDESPAKYVYVSIPDVRFFPRTWATNILVRGMKHDKDWTGGYNNYCDICGLKECVDARMEEEVK